jgi:hypothetical protein
MAREKAIEICKNIKKTLSKQISKTCTEFSNPMFNRPTLKVSVLKKQMGDLIKKHNIKKEEL